MLVLKREDAGFSVLERSLPLLLLIMIFGKGAAKRKQTEVMHS
jgi:hypothetical protein